MLSVSHPPKWRSPRYCRSRQWRSLDPLSKDHLSVSNHATTRISPESVAKFDRVVNVLYGQIGPLPNLQGPNGIGETERLRRMAGYAGQRFFWHQTKPRTRHVEHQQQRGHR